MNLPYMTCVFFMFALITPLIGRCSTFMARPSVNPYCTKCLCASDVSFGRYFLIILSPSSHFASLHGFYIQFLLSLSFRNTICLISSDSVGDVLLKTIIFVIIICIQIYPLLGIMPTVTITFTIKRNENHNFIFFINVPASLEFALSGQMDTPYVKCMPVCDTIILFTT